MAEPHFLCRRWETTAGSITNMKLVENVDIGPPPDDAVTIAVRAIGLNFADVFSLLGLYSATPQGTFTPGLEVAGTVAALGKQAAKHFKLGQRVYGVTRFGGYTERLHLKMAYVKPIPAGWSFSEAAAFPAQALTAWYGLVELGGLRAGQRVLVHSAAGGTGLWATRFARHLGADVVGTVGTAGKTSKLCALTGLSSFSVVDRSSCGGTAAMQKELSAAAGGKKFDVVFDSLMGDWFAASHGQLAPMGRHIVLGTGSMTPPGSRPNWLALAWRWLQEPLRKTRFASCRS